MPAPRITLASLALPPDTSRLRPCEEGLTKRALAVLSARYHRRREVLAARGSSGLALERVLGALRRLQGLQVCAYETADGVVVSEPFNAVPSSIRLAASSTTRVLVSALLGRAPPATLTAALAPFGDRALRLAVNAGVRMTIVPNGRPFTQCSPAVAALVPDIDRWQAPPAGLFVLEEKLILLRSGALRMAAAHEFAHALDALLANRPRSYFSFENAEIRASYAAANGFINEYAASGLDEYFAESMRAYVEVSDDRSSWLPLTRKDLQTRDARMFSIIDGLFRAERL